MAGIEVMVENWLKAIRLIKKIFRSKTTCMRNIELKDDIYELTKTTSMTSLPGFVFLKKTHSKICRHIEIFLIVPSLLE